MIYPIVIGQIDARRLLFQLATRGTYEPQSRCRKIFR